jgi:hypothetical protein
VPWVQVATPVLWMWVGSFSSLNGFGVLVQIIWLYTWGFSFRLSSFGLCVFRQAPPVFISVTLKSGSVKFPTLVFFFKIALGIWGSLQISPSILGWCFCFWKQKQKHHHWNFDRDSSDAIDHLEYVLYHSTTLSCFLGCFKIMSISLLRISICFLFVWFFLIRFFFFFFFWYLGLNSQPCAC